MNKTVLAQAPRELVAKALVKCSKAKSEYSVRPDEVPADAYALLIFACTIGCPAERIAENRFRIHSREDKGSTFAIRTDDDFRKSFKQMVKVFFASSDERIEYLKRSEQFAEACLNSAVNQREINGSLPLAADVLATSRSSNDVSKSHEQEAAAPVEHSAIRKSSTVSRVKPYEVKDYQTAGYGVVHDSSVILEVEYTDGLKTYRCAICDFEGEHYRSITGHMNAHTVQEREEALKNPSRKAIAGYSWEPTPRQSTRISRLANEISTAMNDLGLTAPESIARAIIEARAKNPERDDNDELLPTEMTAEQQLEAIRKILGADLVVQEERSKQEKLIRGLQNQIDTLRSEMREKDQDKANMEKKFEDYRRKVQLAQSAFQDLV